MLLLAAGRCCAEKTFYPGPWAGDIVVGPGMQARGKNLSSSSFIEQDLTSADFDGTDLTSACFKTCQLARASFRGAYLGSTVFEDCYGGGDRVEGQTFGSVDFTDADIQGTQFVNTRISATQLMSTRSYKKRSLARCWLTMYQRDDDDDALGVSFAGFDLSEAHLFGNFTGVDFAGARIAGASFDGANVRFAQLAATQNYRTRAMQNMILRFENEDVDFSGVDLSESRLTVKNGNLRLEGAFISRASFGANIGSQIMKTASYKKGEILFANMGTSDLSGVDLSRQNLTGCRFSVCKLVGTVFTDTVISGADFRDVPGHEKGLTVEQIKSTWNYKNGRMDGIILPKGIADALAREKTDAAREPSG